MAPHPTHRPDGLSSKNECGRGDVSQPKGPKATNVKPRAGASFKFDRAPLPLGTIDKPAVAFLPATAGAPTSIGAGAGKIADWSIAGRIGEGQPVPRFGSVARSPLTGRGSDGRPVQFLDTSAVLRARSCAITPVSVKSVRPVAAVRIVGARIAVRCAVVEPVRAGLLEKLKLGFRRVLHALKHGVEHEQCGQQKLRNGSPR